MGERIIKEVMARPNVSSHPFNGLFLGSSTLKFAMPVSAKRLKCNLNSSFDYKSYSEWRGKTTWNKAAVTYF